MVTNIRTHKRDNSIAANDLICPFGLFLYTIKNTLTECRTEAILYVVRHKGKSDLNSPGSCLIAVVVLTKF